MKFFTRRFAVVAVLALVGLGLVGSAAHAQYPRVRSGRAFPVVQNIYPAFVPTQLQQSQFRYYLYQTELLGRAYSTWPPYLLGYNPYPQVVNYGPVYPYVAPAYGYTPYVNPYAGYVNPYAGYVNPYLNPYAGYVVQ
jgi:hypothetical protein